MAKEIALEIPEHCGNSPRQRMIRNFNIAGVTEDADFLLESLDDAISWIIIGGDVSKGKEE